MKNGKRIQAHPYFGVKNSLFSGALLFSKVKTTGVACNIFISDCVSMFLKFVSHVMPLTLLLQVQKTGTLKK